MTRYQLNTPALKGTLLASVIGALAQGAGAEESVESHRLQAVEVVGQSASVEEALASQRAADNIQTTVSADAIGQLPDTNVSESLQRLPGVSIERDQGEGRFVRVRGLAPDYNAVDVDGVQIPAPEAGRRAVALDVVPADLLESLTVVKTLTPDMDANSLGGTVQVRSLSAFDRPGLYYSVTGKGSYNELMDETSPELSAAFSNRFSIGSGEDNFGVAAAFSWSERDFGSDNVETGGGWDFDDGDARLEEFEQRDYTITRERLGLALNFDYLPNDNSRYYLRTLHSRFRDEEIRQANVFGFEEAMAPNETGAVEVQKELKNREETQKITSVVFGGEQRWDDWAMEYRIGHSRASEDEPRHTGGAVFAAEFDDGGYYGSHKPRPVFPSGFFDDALYELDEVEVAQSDTKDRQTDLKLDFTRDLMWNQHFATLKFGGKVARRDKESDAETWIYEPEGNLSDFAKDVDYGLGEMGSGIDTSVDNLLSGPGERDDEASAIEDYDISEDSRAAYVMGTVDVGDLRVLGGVRYQSTDFSARGYGVEDGDIVANRFNEDEQHWLPALHLRYRVGPDTQIRAAFTQSVVRPTFEQLSPGYEIDGDEASFGNPGLKSLEADNYDLGIEHYMGRAGVVSAFLFYKDLKNFVYRTDVGGASGYEMYDEAETFENGDSASLYGLELAYSKTFSGLPAPFNGLLVGANATLVDSEARIRAYDEDAGGYRDRTIALPSQSDLTANLMVGYETRKLSLRLAANYTGNYLQEVQDPLDKRYDIHVDDHIQLDFTGHYFLTERLQLTFEAINLTDEPFYAYTGRERYNAQYEEYGATYKLGLSLKHY